MKKKVMYCIYLATILFLSLLPFAGMSVAATNETTENKELVEFPKLRTDGKWNVNFLQDLGGYFEEHFAFRQQLVAANAVLKSSVLGVSSSDQIIVGKEGWLYYTGTLDDYLGENGMSDRGISNAVYNIGLMQQYIESKGSKFIITIAPNKNSVYSNNMPFYYRQGEENNYSKIRPLLDAAGIHYVDLYDIFQDSEETLYLKEDSHWNNKGALLVCRRLMDALGKDYDASMYSGYEVRKEHMGDLAEMLYSVAAQPEEDVYYDQIPIYAYMNDAASAEDDWIETINPSREGTLLMFRDSFGISMLPFLANEFEYGYFSRLVPYNLGNLDKYHPNYVIAERVERRISFFAENPPVMEGPLRTTQNLTAAATGTTLSAKADGSWYVLEGTIDPDFAVPDSNIYISLRSEGGESVTYEAFRTSVAEEDGWNDYGYKLYLQGTSVPEGTVYIDVILVNSDTQSIVKTQEMAIK